VIQCFQALILEKLSFSISYLCVEPNLFIENDKNLKKATREDNLKRTLIVIVYDTNYKTYTNTGARYITPKSHP